MVAAFRKGNEGCFTCRNKNHLKRDTLKKANKKPPRICPQCHRGMHCVKDCKSKFNIEGKPIPGNFKQGTPPPPPRSPTTKTRGKFYLFPQTFNIWQWSRWYTNLNDFFLYPQAVPSRVPTRLFGSLPPQTFGLLLGQSSLTSKGITVHPEVIDSGYKGEIQIMTSSQILYQLKKGDKIAQLLLLPYISINSSNNVWTGGFSSTDKKQSL